MSGDPKRSALSLAADPPPVRPPAHLRAATRRWFVQTVEDYDLDAHHLHLLEAACRAWDRMSEATDVLRRDGTYVADRFGTLRAHPAVQVERDSRIAFARLVRELDLDGEPLPDPRMPRRR